MPKPTQFELGRLYERSTREIEKVTRDWVERKITDLENKFLWKTVGVVVGVGATAAAALITAILK